MKDNKMQIVICGFKQRTKSAIPLNVKIITKEICEEKRIKIIKND